MVDSRSVVEARALRAEVGGTVRPLAAVLFAVYLLLSVAHPVFVTEEGRWLLAAVALLSCLLAGTVLLLWNRRGDSGRFAHGAVAALTIVALLNSNLHLLVDPDPVHTGNVMLVVVLMGLLFLARLWFYGLLLTALGVWSAIVLLRPLAGAEQWGWFLVFATFAAVLLMEQRRNAAVRAARREHALQRHARLLQALVKAPELAQADLGAMCRRITETASDAMEVGRVGIWRFEEGGLKLTDLYDAGSLAHSADAFLHRDDYGSYFAALGSDRVLAAGDARHDPRTACLLSYLEEEGIGALLDAPILLRGEVVGVLCHEHCGGPRQWSMEEQTLAASLAEIVALAMQSHERADLERRVFEAERLERMGVLAGGVAHDFNNLLTVVLGNAELLELDLPEGSTQRQKVENIRSAGEGATQLARQMLAYAGRGSFMKATHDLGPLVEELVDGFRSARGEELDVKLELPEQPLVAEIDPTQIRQVLLNLLTNSAEADSSSVWVTAGSCELEQRDIDACVVADGVEPGPYCFIEVRDDGVGMTADVVQHMFDPFYTTKATGSGLGLAACLGILRAHQGTIAVTTTPGRGARVRVLMPPSAQPASNVVRRLSGTHPVAGRLEVLVVEDQRLVRDLAERMLRASGHDVLALAGIETLDQWLAGDTATSPDLAVVDLTLADGDGVQAVKRLRDRFRGLPIVLMSGYDSTDALTRIVDHSHLTFLEKPFAASELDDAMALALRGSPLAAASSR